MVVFTCSHCGQAVKKNQVEKHCNFQCRGCQSLSCMDCGKVFWGNEYKEHNKCITENEKYGGKDYQPKASSNKGEVKQEKWIEHIKNTMATKKISGPLSNILEKLMQYPNIPRKKSKFENFLQNSLNFRNPKLINEAWEIFAQSTSSESSTTPLQYPAVNGRNGPAKRPLDDKEESNSKKPCLNGIGPSKGGNPNQSFNWIEVIENLLNSSQNPIPMKTLRKQVLTEYRATVKDSILSKVELKKLFKDNVSHSEMFMLSKTK